MEAIFGHTKLILEFGGLTRHRAGAIVNAANSSLMGGGGVYGAIHRVGGHAILKECKAIISQIGRLAPGKVVITTGGNLPAKNVIHTVGPVWEGGNNNEDGLIESCYKRSLEIASEKGLKTIAFPCISTGIYHFPKERAAGIAISVVKDFFNKCSSIEKVMRSKVFFIASSLSAALKIYIPS